MKCASLEISKWNQNIIKMKKHIAALLTILSFNTVFLIDNCISQWFSQPLPVSGQVQDLKFFDANTGLILMNAPFRSIEQQMVVTIGIQQYTINILH